MDSFSQHKSLDQDENKNPSQSSSKKKLSENKKFKTACEQIEDSVKKYLENHSLDSTENEEIEEDNSVEDSLVIERILRGYDESQNLDTVHHHLHEALRSGSLICLICIENIKRLEYVWNCEKCFTSFHLDCIQKWAKDSIYLQSKSEDFHNLSSSAESRKAKEILKWFCPKCRGDYPNTRVPSEYKCFCGKETNPKFDPWLVPHSCGEKCGKKLKPECGHSCLILCHPGPCPPCPAMVSCPCYCPQRKTQMRRCSAKEWSCNSICSSLLNCQQHHCDQKCHAGSCSTCSRTSVQKCRCGEVSQLRQCSDVNWQCDKVCGKNLSCGHHKCEIICHAGECGDCPYGGKRCCPCGKSMTDLPCTESVSSCGDTCSKPLECGVHLCAERCHKGPCPTCLQFLVKRCNCGAKEKEYPCAKSFTCDVKCKKIKDCRKHTCNRRCCTGDCPSCEHPCGKTLGCGQHKCQSRCHQMRCYPCTVTHKISCSCGQTSIVVPCGRERKTPIPKCSKLCMKPPVCHHPKSEAHKCHPGDCPQCKIICNLKLSCKHSCPVKCHDAVPVKIVSIHKPVGPWDKVPPRIEIQKLPCPPCKYPVPNTCLGKHETCDWPCSELRPFSCGRKCGRLLNCSLHSCELKCHAVLDAQDDNKEGSNCESCQLPCSQARPKECPHKCELPCHRDACPECKEIMKKKCHCGLLQVYVKCNEWISKNLSEREKVLSCTNRCNKTIKCGHLCKKECHSGPCSTTDECETKIPLRCPCKRYKKKVMCYLAANDMEIVSCNRICLKLAKEKEEKEKDREEQRKTKEEEDLKREMREYGKFLYGYKRKRKNKNSMSTEKEELPFGGNKIFCGLTIFVIFISWLICLYYIKEGVLYYIPDN